MTPEERKKMAGIVGFGGSTNHELLGFNRSFKGNKNQDPFSGDSISVKLANTGTSAEARLIAFCPGWYSAVSQIKDKDGNTAAAIMADGNFITTADKVVSATGINVSVNDVVEGTKINPYRVKGIKVVGDTSAQLDEKIEIQELGFNGKNAPRILIPSSYKSSDNADDKRAEINLLDSDSPVVFGPETVVLVKLAASRTVTLTIFYDLVKSQSTALQYIAKM